MMEARNTRSIPPGEARQLADQITKRLLRSMPAATFEMETFSRLASIAITNNIPTAAVECRHRPRLLLNPDFVAQYCERDEHLFLLVMHELWHVILAHTSVYKRMTLAHNVAFDAIINARLVKHFSGPTYRGFFERLNPSDKFPHVLLRPPEGWPDKPVYPDDIGPEGTNRILRQLYPPSGMLRVRMPFYVEILDLIKQDQRERGISPDGIPVLIGDHSEDAEQYLDDDFRQALEELTEKWPLRPGGFGPPGLGVSRLRDWEVDHQKGAYEARRVLAHVLRRCVAPQSGVLRRKERLPIPGITGLGVLPNSRDRTMSAKTQLGMDSLLWTQNGEVKVRVPDDRACAHIYLDVSGSMARVLPYMLNLLVPYLARGEAQIFQFSTKVEALSLQKLKRGLIKTTGGTQIHCVFSHLLETSSPVRRAMVLTDGYTGRPLRRHAVALAEKRIRLHVVLPSESPYDRYLRDVATSITILPPLDA